MDWHLMFCILGIIIGWNKDEIWDLLGRLVYGSKIPALKYYPDHLCKHCGRKAMWHAQSCNEYEIPGGWHCAFGCHDLITDTEFDAMIVSEVPENKICSPVEFTLQAPALDHMMTNSFVDGNGKFRAYP